MHSVEFFNRRYLATDRAMTISGQALIFLWRKDVLLALGSNAQCLLLLQRCGIVRINSNDPGGLVAVKIVGPLQTPSQNCRIKRNWRKVQIQMRLASIQFQAKHAK